MAFSDAQKLAVIDQMTTDGQRLLDSLKSEYEKATAAHSRFTVQMAAQEGEAQRKMEAEFPLRQKALTDLGTRLARQEQHVSICARLLKDLKGEKLNMGQGGE
ncbi:MAG: hypothetical protein KGL39_49105 [Patescibacteria group bacterium]|nr:hypothetical protein [Patescibacteria group bacterium]